uniref:Major facilitator superfamily (MFS) profile domain-containing protein n=2 Tax=Photinus pyralis TaxID=7054 RepID=A0A1Y1K9J5_PHOPY
MAKNEIQINGELEKFMPPAKEEQNVDIVEKCMGVMGRWQILICVSVFLCKLPIAWHQLNIVLLAPPTVFSCAENMTEKCSSNCSDIVFDRSIFTNTIQMEWNLICDRSQLVNFAQTITMLGILIGNFIFGLLSDKFGRRNPLIWAVIIQLISGTATAFAPWFWLFLLLRFISAAATGGTMVTSFVLVMEITGIKWRTTLGILYQVPFNVGHLSLALIGYLIRDWHYVQLAITLPSLLLISYYWIIPESPRWLLALGQPEKAIKVMEKACRFNKLETSSITEDVHIYMKKRSIEQATGTFMDLVRTKSMRVKSISIFYNWVVCGLCFFGGAQYMGQLGGNVFVNIAMSAVIQIPGTIFSIWFMQSIGRRYTLMGSDFLAGLSFLLISFVPEDAHWPRVLLGTLGMFGLSVCFPTVYIYSGELYPTVIRNIGVGTSSMFARVGSMLAPFVAGLASYQPWLAPAIFGIVPLIGAALCYYLPETKNCVLPETLEDAEKFSRQRKGSVAPGLDSTIQFEARS